MQTKNKAVSFSSNEIRWTVKDENGKWFTVKRLRLNGRLEAFNGDGFDEPIELSQEQYKASLKAMETMLKGELERVQRMLAGRDTIECPFDDTDQAAQTAVLVQDELV